ncbi:hypothetical protein V6U81_20420 [Micromonospora sp. CPCC 205711]|uniref:VHL beta domain-containing protein n=1 Tax=Micromonospora sp. CPCC 205547 TaxID=3122400 RepID=UPI002FF04D11
MADSPDDTHRTDPTLRIGGRLPGSRRREGLPSYPSTVDHDGRHRAEPSPVVGRSAPGPRWDPAPGGPGRTLVLACVAVGVLATLVFALSPFWSGPEPAEDGAAPSAPSTGAADSEVVGLESPTPNVMFSPAPVSLSTRAALPPRPPTQRPTRPAGGTTSRPSPSTTPPKPPATRSPVAQPRPDELQPMPPSQEPALRSSSGGPETFIDFVNARGSQVVVYWLDYGGQRQPYAVLEAGQGYRQQTYVGHPWVVTDAGGTALVCFLPAPETKKAVVR